MQTISRSLSSNHFLFRGVRYAQGKTTGSCDGISNLCLRGTFAHSLMAFMFCSEKHKKNMYVIESLISDYFVAFNL